MRFLLAILTIAVLAPTQAPAQDYRRVTLHGRYYYYHSPVKLRKRTKFTGKFNDSFSRDNLKNKTLEVSRVGKDKKELLQLFEVVQMMESTKDKDHVLTREEFIRRLKAKETWNVIQADDCYHCGGDGKTTIGEKCRWCKGKGTTHTHYTIKW